MSMERQEPRLSLSSQVFIGLGLGIATGLFLGELASPLNLVGMAFINLLMMSVLPYVVLSLVGGLGRLTVAEAKGLALKGGRILVALWAIVLVTVLLIPLAFPEREGASFFSTTVLEEKKPFDFMGLFLPSNPFHAMANTIVPAVVVFSIALGLALIPVKNKQNLIQQLDTLIEALTRITGFVARLAPIGVFAITGAAAGRLAFSELGRLQVYLLTYFAMAFFLALWVLPALVMSFTNISYRRLFAGTRGALVTAFATGNLLIILPMLAEESKRLIAEELPGDRRSQSAVDVLTPASFNFPNMGKLLTLCFIPFAAWFAGSPLAAGKYVSLLTVGLPSFFGEVIVAIPFLLDLLELPADLLRLFLSVDVFVGFSGTLLAAMHVLVFTLLGAYAMAGRLKVRWPRLIRNAGITALAWIALLASLRIFFVVTAGQDYRMDQALAEMQILRDPVEATVHKEPPPPPPEEPELTRFELVRSRGRIRIGYFRRYLPYTFFNARGELVGFDAEMAHSLARGMNVRPVFVPVDPDRFAEQLRSGYCDIVMSGVVVTTERSNEVTFTAPYLLGTLGFLVRDHRRDEFSSLDSIRKLTNMRIGVGKLPYYIRMLQRQVPSAKIVTVSTSEELDRILSTRSNEVDALLLPLEEAAAWSILYPSYSPVAPQPDIVRVPLAYAVPLGEEDLQDAVNTWITLKENDGTIHDLYDYWVLGRGAVKREPRWSIIRNVLGWVK